VIDAATVPLSSQIVSAMSQAFGSGANLERIILGGGLMIPTAKHILPHYRNAVLAQPTPEDMVFAVARGYYSLLQYLARGR